MLTLKVRVSGLKEFMRKTDAVIKELDKGTMTNAIEKKCKNRAKYRGPRKTGKLIRHIHTKKTSANSFTLICDAISKQGENYPRFLEEGTKYIPIGTPEHPRAITSGGGKLAFLPFMRWAIWRTLQEKDKIFRETILKHYK